MFQIDNSTSVAVKPTPEAAGTPGYFTNGDPIGGVPATIVEADWLNMVQDELTSILTAAGITPNKAASNQVLLALQALGLKIATTAQAQAWSDDATIITPKKLAEAFKGANQSLSLPGFQKLPGGLIIQVFTLTNSNNAGTGLSISSFPYAFPNTCLAIAKMNQASASGGFVTGDACWVSLGDTQMSWTAYDSSNALAAAAGSIGVNFIAIGY